MQLSHLCPRIWVLLAAVPTAALMSGSPLRSSNDKVCRTSRQFTAVYSAMGVTEPVSAQTALYSMARLKYLQLMEHCMKCTLVDIWRWRILHEVYSVRRINMWYSMLYYMVIVDELYDSIVIIICRRKILVIETTVHKINIQMSLAVPFINMVQLSSQHR